MPETIDTIVISSLDSEQQAITEKTRKKKQPASRAYMQDYYLEHKGAFVCEHCDRIYTCKSSRSKHEGRNIKCYVERINSMFDEIRHTPAEDFIPENIFAKMENRIPTK